MSTFYTRGQFVEFCKSVFGPYRMTNAGVNMEVVCPICKHLKERKTGRAYTNRKLAIHTESHVLHCWVCGYKSKNPIHLLTKFKPEYLQRYLDKFVDAEELKAYNEYNKKSESEKPVVAKLPDGFTLLVTADPTDSYVRAARNYLKARGADSEAMLWYWRMGITKASRDAYNRIIIPSFNEHGALNYYSARAIKPNMIPRYSNPDILREDIVFNELNIDWKSELILVEGVFDLLKCPDNASCLLGSELPSHFSLFQKIVENETPVVLALDPEAENKAYKIARRLLEFDIKVKIVKLKANQEDVGSLTKSQFNELLESAMLFNMEYLLRSKINKLI